MKSGEIFGLEVFYSGLVQGVGFRYTTLQIAKNYEVVGEVKNLLDGRVYVAAQGEKKEVQEFKNELEGTMVAHIEKKEEKFLEIPSYGYEDFSITRVLNS